MPVMLKVALLESEIQIIKKDGSGSGCSIQVVLAGRFWTRFCHFFYRKYKRLGGQVAIYFCWQSTI
jgi:hypothetical protein